MHNSAKNIHICAHCPSFLLCYLTKPETLLNNTVKKMDSSHKTGLPLSL